MKDEEIDNPKSDPPHDPFWHQLRWPCDPNPATRPVLSTCRCIGLVTLIPQHGPSSQQMRWPCYPDPAARPALSTAALAL